MLLSEPAAAQRHKCPCGAVAERQNDLCRKCQARAAWRRKALQKTRRGARRLAARRTRTLMRLLNEAMPKGDEK